MSDEGGWYWICEVRDTGYYHLVATITLGNTTYKGEASGYDSLTINAVYRDIKLYPTHGTPTGGGDE
ncbi:MAG: hypothetical protein GF307_08185 [candidate division Zixibacteria bacterium]|nr:hypothetical protein [candidate division Zixibacteria bacterium]